MAIYVAFSKGKFAKEAFSLKKREKILNLFDFESPEQKNEFREVLSHFSVSLRIISSRDPINVLKYSDFNKKLFKKIRNLFPWMLSNKTVHNFLGHAHQAIQKNGGYGLFHRSEAPLEAMLLEIHALL